MPADDPLRRSIETVVTSWDDVLASRDREAIFTLFQITDHVLTVLDQRKALLN